MNAAGVETHAERFVAMGTRIELHQFGAAAPDALLAGRRAIQAVDDALTIHRPSATTIVNERLMTGEVATTGDSVLLDALATIAEACRLTGGLFDPTVGSGEQARWSTVSFDPEAGRIESSVPVAFDFGGFGKGFALDRAAVAMRAAGVTSAFLSAGESSVAVIGDHPLGGAWPVAIPHPLDPDRWLVELSLRDEALSVSSTVGAGAAAPGRSPTIRPSDRATITAAATTVAINRSGAIAEAMSTALLVAKRDAIQRLIDRDHNRRFFFSLDDTFCRVTA